MLSVNITVTECKHLTGQTLLAVFINDRTHVTRKKIFRFRHLEMFPFLLVVWLVWIYKPVLRVDKIFLMRSHKKWRPITI